MLRVTSFVEVLNSSSVKPNTQPKRLKLIKVKLGVFSFRLPVTFWGSGSLEDKRRGQRERVRSPFTLASCLPFYLPPPSLLPRLQKTKQIHPSLYTHSPLHLDSSKLSKTQSRAASSYRASLAGFVRCAVRRQRVLWMNKKNLSTTRGDEGQCFPPGLPTTRLSDPLPLSCSPPSSSSLFSTSPSSF